MKFLPKFLKLSQASRNAGGFTLTELMIAMSLTSIMMTLAGYGTVAMLRANQANESDTVRRVNLNRALDFMADEVRMAKALSVPTNNEVPNPSCGTAAGVLTLTMPDDSKITYYINNVSTCTNSLWAKPANIRRVSGSSDTILVDGLMAPTTIPSCTGGTLTGANGFYACVSSTNNHLATLYLYGKLNDAYGNTTGTQQVSSQVFARSF